MCLLHVTVSLYLMIKLKLLRLLRWEMTPLAVTHVNCTLSWHKQSTWKNKPLHAVWSHLPHFIIRHDTTRYCQNPWTYWTTASQLLEKFACLARQQADFSSFCLGCEAPVIVTIALTLCAIMEMRIDCCIVVLNRKDIINACISVENSFISKHTEASGCHTCSFQDLRWKHAGNPCFYSRWYFTWEYTMTNIIVNVALVSKHM